MGFLKKLQGHLVAPKANISLQLSGSYVVLGDNLEGTLTIMPDEVIDAEEIRCEIQCKETARVLRTDYDPTVKRMVTREVTENRILYEAKPACSSATQLVTRVSRTFNFSVNIPAGARSTFMSTNDTVQWQIKGVVAVHGRPDVTTDDMQFQVIPENQRPANEAPKIRLIACEYCQKMMPENSLACPNCGAKRTAN
jgi:hypothetical protein